MSLGEHRGPRFDAVLTRCILSILVDEISSGPAVVFKGSGTGVAPGRIAGSIAFVYYSSTPGIHPRPLSTEVYPQKYSANPVTTERMHITKKYSLDAANLMYI